MKKEKQFYSAQKDWDFSAIKYEKEQLTDWDLFEKIRETSNKNSKILDLGTGGGERVLSNYPEVAEILGTDFSEEMIKTAKKNLEKSGKKNVEFRVMDNLAMDTADEYYDVVTARHTVIDPVQIFKTLKPGGSLIVRGVDQIDCLELKKYFGFGQDYDDRVAISRADYEAILDAGFVDVELVPIHVREYYKTREDLLALLYKTPILVDWEKGELFDKIDPKILDKYIADHSKPKGILLIRRYYGITAKKPAKH